MNKKKEKEFKRLAQSIADRIVDGHSIEVNNSRLKRLVSEQLQRMPDHLTEGKSFTTRVSPKLVQVIEEKPLKEFLNKSPKAVKQVEKTENKVNALEERMRKRLEGLEINLERYDKDRFS